MFSDGESLTLKAFNDYTIIMTNIINDYINSPGCSGEFHVVFKHFGNLENLIRNILKKKLHMPWLKNVTSPWKVCKAFRITVQIAMIRRSSHRRCFIKKVFSEISKNPKENTYARVSSTLLKKRLWY